MAEPTVPTDAAQPTEPHQPEQPVLEQSQAHLPPSVPPQPYYPPYPPFPPPPGAFAPYLPPPPPPQRPASSRLPNVLLVAAGALVAIVIVFGVLDLTHTLFPAPDNSTRPVIIQFQGGSGTANAVLQVSPATLTLACKGSAAIMLTNTGGIPLSWQVGTLPDSVLLSSSSPHSGTLASGQRVALTVVSLGRAGAGQLHFSDDRKEDVTAQVVVTCP